MWGEIHKLLKNNINKLARKVTTPTRGQVFSETQVLVKG